MVSRTDFLCLLNQIEAESRSARKGATACGTRRVPLILRGASIVQGTNICSFVIFCWVLISLFIAGLEGQQRAIPIFIREQTHTLDQGE